MSTEQDQIVKLNVLISSYNRKSSTLSLLQSLITLEKGNFELKIYLVDSNSSDGTPEEIQEKFKDVVLIKGLEHWYWAKAMNAADCAAYSNPGDILWLNDDVELTEDAIIKLFNLTTVHSNSILVGQCASKVTGKITYGGFLKSSRHPFRYRRVVAERFPLPCDTFNGNFLYVPRSVREKIGPIDSVFEHRLADLDYGLRARQAGIETLLIPGVIGYCEHNEEQVPLKILDRLKTAVSIKNYPIVPMWTFAARHGGFEFPIYVVAPYLRAIFNVYPSSKVSSSK